MAISARTMPAAGELLERDEALAVLRGAFSEVLAGSGRMVLVAGEAGVGKTSLVRAFERSVRGANRILEGACDALATPRPLGAFADLTAVSGDLSGLPAADATGHELVAALRVELADSPSVLVLEDLHWADEATLDVVRVLGRRASSMRALVIVTYREDALGPAHPLRITLGDLAGVPALWRMTLDPLSPQSVARLARGSELDAGELYRRTGGNPFYVCEVLDSGVARVPNTVRDAITARIARMSPGAREALDVVSIAPPALELAALEQVVGEPAEAAIDQCLTAGMLVERGIGVGFRHELAREAVESSLGPGRRRGLHRAVLLALETASSAPDPARLAHHAEGAGQSAAVLRYAPLAGDRAGRLGAHREAAAQYARALRFAGALPPLERAALLMRLAEAQYATDDQADALGSWSTAVECYREAGDLEGEAAAQCQLVTNYVCRGEMHEARASAARALELLEPMDAPREAGLAYNAMALLSLGAGDMEAARDWATRAIEVGTAYDDGDMLVEGMIRAGTADAFLEGPAATGMLERALAEARARRLAQRVPHVLNNMAVVAVEHNDFATANSAIEEGLAHCAEYDLDLWALALLGLKARAQLDQAHFEVAGEVGSLLAEDLHDSPAPRVEGLRVLALVRARRGDPGVHDALDRLMASGYPADEIDWAGPVALAGAEIAWLEGNAEQIGEITAAAFEMARTATAVPWILGALAGWRARAGLQVDPGDVELPEPWALELAGRHDDAAAAWERLGRPYEAAVVLGLGGDRIEEAHARLRDLGAAAPAAIFARRLRESGVRGISRGPRPSTRENPANLTPREVEVLSLVADGLSNAEIAQRLHLSVRTVDHHVSSILRKLDVPSRARAGVEAARLGITADMP